MEDAKWIGPIKSFVFSTFNSAVNERINKQIKIQNNVICENQA